MAHITNRRACGYTFKLPVKYRLLYWLVMFCSGAVAQTGGYNFDNVNGVPGISGISVTAVVQDSTGYIWLGTVDGLKKFDGYTATTYRHKTDDRYSLADNEIVSLCVDADNNIWAGTINGLSVLNRKTNRFQSFIRNGNSDSGICGNVITGLTKDAEGNILVATYDGGLCIAGKYNNTYSFTKTYRAINTSAPVLTQLFATCFDASKNLWAATESGLFFFSKDGTVLKKFTAAGNSGTNITNSSVFKLWPMNDGSVWISGKGMLDRITCDPGNNNRFTVRHFLPFVAGTRNLNSWNINDFIIDRHNNGWIATNDFGIIKFSLAIDSVYNVERYQSNEMTANSLGSSLCNDLFEDKTGTVWIGTEKGVSKYIPAKKRFSEYMKPAPLQTGRDILAILHDNRRRTWIGYDADTILVTDMHNNKRLDMQLKLPGLQKNLIDQVNCVIQGADNSIYIGTLLQGVFVLKDTRGNLARRQNWRQLNRQNTPELISNDIFCFAKDTAGNIWIGTYKGACKYLPATGKLIPVYTSPTKKAMPGYSVFAIACDSKGNALCGTDDGLVMLKTDGSTTVYRHIASDTTSISHDQVNCIYTTKNGQVFVGTKTGLNLFDMATGSFKRIKANEGSFEESVRSIQEDHLGNLWLGTYHGLVKYNRQLHTLHTYTTVDGLASDQFLNNACAIDDPGKMYFGSKKGLVVFDPAAVAADTNTYPVVITNIKILNTGLDATGDTALQQQFNVYRSLHLDYRQNFLSFEFAALNYNNSSSGYMYMMEGLDKDWIKAGTKRFADYTAIKPGTYVFKVKAANSDGVWNNTPAMLKIVITPPWWQTWWFYLLMSCTITAIVYAVYRIRINQLMKLYNLRSNIAKDLHDDVGSALSSISLLSNMAQQGKTTAHLQPQEIFSRIGDTSKKMIDLMDDIVWSVNPDNDRFANMLVRMREYAAEMLEAKEIDFSFSADTNTGDLKIPMQMRKDYFLIYKEAINNLAKYACASNAAICITHRTKALVTIIQDNGKGFDPLMVHAGNGLKNMQQRAAHLKASLKIDTAPARGTTITLTMVVP